MNPTYEREKRLGEEAVKIGLCVVCRKRPISYSRSSKRCDYCLDSVKRVGKTYRDNNKENPKFKKKYNDKSLRRLSSLLSNIYV